MKAVTIRGTMKAVTIRGTMCYIRYYIDCYCKIQVQLQNAKTEGRGKLYSTRPSEWYKPISSRLYYCTKKLPP